MAETVVSMARAPVASAVSKAASAAADEASLLPGVQKEICLIYMKRKFCTDDAPDAEDNFIPSGKPDIFKFSECPDDVISLAQIKLMEEFVLFCMSKVIDICEVANGNTQTKCNSCKIHN